MSTDQFDYYLPPSLIADYPLPKRPSSRLLVVNKASESFSHANFLDIKDLLRSGDLMVLNDTKVIPSRLAGRVERRGRVEFLLTEKKEETLWKILIRNPRKGLRIELEDGTSGSVEKTPDGGWAIRFSEPVEEMMEKTGLMPLPPYISREPESSDRETYQTVYAAEEGAVAAPTAGLHFDLELLSALREKGVLTEYVTLHVGEGTFRPVKEDLVEKHRMHSERLRVSQKTSRAANLAKAEKRRIVAVGTTVVRALESAGRGGVKMESFSGRTDLFIKPPYEFGFVDVLVTNFHMPRSTLLMLVSAFCGKELALSAYAEAVRKNYRFLSYGDSMIIM